jgi:hypothetical protein
MRLPRSCVRIAKDDQCWFCGLNQCIRQAYQQACGTEEPQFAPTMTPLPPPPCRAHLLLPSPPRVVRYECKRRSVPKMDTRVDVSVDTSVDISVTRPVCTLVSLLPPHSLRWALLSTLLSGLLSGTDLSAPSLRPLSAPLCSPLWQGEDQG